MKNNSTAYYPKNLLGTIAYFRNIALEIERHPKEISKHLSYQGIDDFYFDRDSDCLSRTQLLEALSYGDVGVLLACPGPSLSGLILRELGNDTQKQFYFNYVETTSQLLFSRLRNLIKDLTQVEYKRDLKRLMKISTKFMGRNG